MCLRYGDVPRSCGGPNKSKLSYKCGGTEDTEKTNAASERCTLCIEQGVRQEDLAHIQGSVRSFGVPWRTSKKSSYNPCTTG